MSVRSSWCSFVVQYASLFVFNDTATTEIYTLSLHDALPICQELQERHVVVAERARLTRGHMQHAAHVLANAQGHRRRRAQDRKSTRLNSSHANISYAVFCLKKPK